MNRQAIALIVAPVLLLALLILWLLFRKTKTVRADVKSRLIDPLTGVEIAEPGARNRSIGPALPPRGSFENWNCPQGFKPVIDPQTHRDTAPAIVCVLEQ